MEQRNLNRMATLFERVVSNLATPSEQIELKHLYDEYFFHGREVAHQHNRQHLRAINGGN